MKQKNIGGPSAPRTISPHKGGRRKRVDIRCTPEVKNMLAEIREMSGETAADLLENAVKSKHVQLTSACTGLPTAGLTAARR